MNIDISSSIIVFFLGSYAVILLNLGLAYWLLVLWRWIAKI